MGHKKGDPKQKAYAAWMKDHKVIRRTAVCPICYRTISIPTDYHFVSGH
jgi:hypothetical protein